jgi:hypothetical protein
MQMALGKRTGSLPVLKIGLCTGASLIGVMLGALVAANRCPALEPYAFERNAISYSAFVILMLVPVCRFLKDAGQMFASSMIGWLMFGAAYDVAGFFFKSLFNAVMHTPFQVLIEGTVAYGVFATSLWLAHMLLYARHHPIKAGRKVSTITARHVR